MNEKIGAPFYSIYILTQEITNITYSSHTSPCIQFIQSIFYLTTLITVYVGRVVIPEVIFHLFFNK